jgi:ribosomal protein L37AE/L43A
MAEGEKLFRCPICYKGDVKQTKKGNGICSNCRNEFVYFKKNGTYLSAKYNKKFGNDRIRENWRSLYREYSPKNGLSVTEWNELAERKGEEFSDRKQEESQHEGIEAEVKPDWAGAVLWPVFFPIVGFIIGIVRMARGGVRKKSGILCFLLSLFFMALYIGMTAGFAGGCGGTAAGSINPYVAMVRNGHLSAYPDKTIGSAVDDFIGNPEWETGVTDDGERIVNVSGRVSYDGAPAEIAIQFILHEDNSLEIWTMELNGMPLSKLEQVGFLEAMYGN